MKDPNPIIPPGASLENSRRGRSKMRLAVVGIVLVHVMVFAGILFNACSQDEGKVAGEKNKEKAQLIESDLPVVPPLPDPVSINPMPALGANAGQPNPDGNEGQSNEGGLGNGGGIEPPPSSGAENPFAGTSPTPVPLASSREHVILQGDNYYVIAKKYGVTVKSLQLSNPAADPRKLQIGQKLAIPTVTTAASSAVIETSTPGLGEYIVQSGDTLSHIALKHGTTVKEIRRVNNLEGDRIFSNQKLRLPPGSRFSTSSNAGTSGTE